MASVATAPSTGSISKIWQPGSIVAVTILAANPCRGERSDLAEKDRPARETEQGTPDSWATYPTDELQFYALPLHTIQGISSNVVTGGILEAAPLSDREEGMYSTWTHFFFHAFSILFIAGIGILTAGYLWAFPLVSAFGPLVLGTAFGCLWYCARRATQEHAI